jgi:hypothetical protein
MIPPRAAMFLLGTSAWILRPKPGNRPRVVYSISIPATRHVSPPSSTAPAPSLPEPHSTCTSAVLTQLTWSLLHVHLRLSMSPDVSHRSRSPGLLVPRSKPHIRPSPLSVHRRGMSLLDLYLTVDHRLQAPHLHTTSQKTCCTNQLKPWLVHKLNPRHESR